jgi:hypothetical protein
VRLAALGLCLCLGAVLVSCGGPAVREADSEPELALRGLDYAGVELTLLVEGRGRDVVLAVVDRRGALPEQAGQTQTGETWVTHDGAPLEDALARSLARGLEQAGFEPTLLSGVAEPADLTPHLDELGLVLFVDAWSTDVTDEAILTRSLSLVVVDAEGRVLGRAEREGQEDLLIELWSDHEDLARESRLTWKREAEFLVAELRGVLR